ncbi:hypothetical protein SG34_017965 [Thalassomonas viridans]|uniref:Uncharacterized protein n=1 Tax=Thalassomonas viridans TaxID=137584 RepID=A0AAE9YZI7_9GAMM|nr:hypothetical protein [Thalassomonas viridans]WDE03279.1 hypothetical protein SG34_017965 [Thalassomonas viridans]
MENPLDIISRLMCYLLGDVHSLSRFSEAQAMDYLVASLLSRDLLIFKMDEPRMTYSGHWGREESLSSSAKNHNLVLEEGSGQGTSQNGKALDKTAATLADSNSGPSSVQSADARAKTEPANKELEARERLIATGEYQPKYSQAELEAQVAQGTIEARFVVTLQKTKSGDNPVGFKRDSGRTTTWTTTFDQMENSDTDPKLLNDLNGMIWDEEAEWEIIIIDQGEYFKQDGGLTFIPTYENTAALGQAEFVKKFNQDKLQAVMTPEYSKEYAAHMKAYKTLGNDPYNRKQLEKYAMENFKDDGDYEAFMARHEYTIEVGTNEHFSGDGLTKTTGESGYLSKGQHGTLETITFEKSPETMDELSDREAIARVSAKKIT